MNTESRTQSQRVYTRLKWSNAQKFGLKCSLPGLIVLIALLFYPVVYNVYMSFQSFDLISPMQFNGLKNYRWLFHQVEFSQSLYVSTIYSFSTSSLSVVLAIIMSYGLSRINRGRTLLRTLSILPWAIPGVISGFMWKWIFNGDVGILNYILMSLGIVEKNVHFLTDPTLGMVAGILATTYISVPFCMVLFLSGLESIPNELYQAAKVDGADHMHQFFRISLPLIKRRIIFAFVLQAMFSFRTPDIFFVLTGGGPGNATYHMGLFLQDLIFRFFELGHGAVIGVVLTMIIIVFATPLFYFSIVKRGDEM